MAKWSLQQITHVACNIPVFTKHRPIFSKRESIYKTDTPIHTRNSHRCSIPTGVLFRSCTFGAGAGGWVLLGPMGLWCPRGCQKLYVLVRKPLAALHSAAGEPLRHASKYLPVFKYLTVSPSVVLLLSLPGAPATYVVLHGKTARPAARACTVGTQSCRIEKLWLSTFAKRGGQKFMSALLLVV